MSLGQAQRSSPPQQRAELVDRLRGRRGEIEQTALSRVHAVSDPAEVGDPLYVAGLRSAVSAAVGFGIAVLQSGAERLDPLPTELLIQARYAARRGVPLDTVLRRYLAGHTLLGEFIFGEAEAIPIGPQCLREALRIEGLALDHLIDVVSREYQGEVRERLRSSERRRAERVERLLAGNLPKASELSYEFEAWHVGMVVVGEQDERALQGLATDLDRRLLLVPRAEDTAWAWLGGGRRVTSPEMERLLAARWLDGARVAVGEPGWGLAGWRLTHRQAAAALPVALRGAAPQVRYADVALLATALGDETLTNSLRAIYLEPLDAKRNEGMVLHETLRAYFRAERTLSSAAVTLGVTRHTVTNRLRVVEELLGRSLGSSAPQLEIALSLEELADDPGVESAA